MLQHLTLCLLTNAKNISFEKYSVFLNQAIAGGITSIQFRDKWLKKTDRFKFAIKLRDFTAEKNIPLIINDDIDLTKAVEADGVHLGQTDEMVTKAREVLGEYTWLGLSIESLPQLRDANKINYINYVAASAIFPSKSKQNCQTYWGLDGLKKFVKLSKHPVVAIGGIELENIAAIKQQGIAGIAVISAIHDADNPQKTVRTMLKLLGA